jgi:hypothetical protein
VEALAISGKAPLPRRPDAASCFPAEAGLRRLSAAWNRRPAGAGHGEKEASCSVVR